MNAYLRLRRGVMAAAVALAAAAPAMAATETGTLTVNAEVEGACSIGDATLTFPTFSSVNVGTEGTLGSTSNVDANTSVDVVCTNGTDGTVTVSDGANSDSGARRLNLATDYIPYHLYSDSYTTEIPTSDSGSYTVNGDGTDQTITVYGRILAADITNQALGSYTDSVTMTITYTP